MCKIIILIERVIDLIAIIKAVSGWNKLIQATIITVLEIYIYQVKDANLMINIQVDGNRVRISYSINLQSNILEIIFSHEQLDALERKFMIIISTSKILQWPVLQRKPVNFMVITSIAPTLQKASKSLKYCEIDNSIISYIILN